MTDAPAPVVDDEPLLRVSHLSLSFASADGPVVPVVDVSFDLREGERVGLVGESGSGKSLTALSVIGLAHRVGARIDPASEILYRGRDLTKLPERERRLLRGGEIAMVFQDPLTSLDPVIRIGSQLVETIRLHAPRMSPADARDRAAELLEQVHLSRPRQLLGAYPHELSGGMRQRVMIAMALAGDPSVLIADEPTTALDVTIQAGILRLLDELCSERGLAVLFITHDLSVVSEFTQRVVVMYGGRIIEQAPTSDLFERPVHPYTGALIRSIPPVDHAVERLIAIPGSPPEPAARPSGCAFHPRCAFSDGATCQTESPPLEVVHLGGDAGVDRHVACHYWATIDLGGEQAVRRVARIREAGDARVPDSVDVRRPILSAVGVKKDYRVKTGAFRSETLHALAGVDLDVAAGEALGIVGQSGSGKTTLARCLLSFIRPTAGSVTFDGTETTKLGAAKLRKLRRHMQMVFQDPASSFDPRIRLDRSLSEPLRIHGLWGQPGYDDDRLAEVLQLVQLPPDALRRHPHQFSGGQLQRLAIARALVLQPKLLVCDEPVSALDVSVRSSVLNLLADLRDELELTLVFIAHDLSLVRFLCDRTVVMYQGSIVEGGPTEDVLEDPQHAHTKELLASHPRIAHDDARRAS